MNERLTIFLAVTAFVAIFWAIIKKVWGWIKNSADRNNWGTGDIFYSQLSDVVDVDDPEMKPYEFSQMMGIDKGLRGPKYDGECYACNPDKMVKDIMSPDCKLPNCKEKNCKNYGSCVEYCGHEIIKGELTTNK